MFVIRYLEKNMIKNNIDSARTSADCSPKPPKPHSSDELLFALSGNSPAGDYPVCVQNRKWIMIHQGLILSCSADTDNIL